MLAEDGAELDPVQAVARAVGPLIDEPFRRTGIRRAAAADCRLQLRIAQVVTDHLEGARLGAADVPRLRTCNISIETHEIQRKNPKKKLVPTSAARGAAVAPRSVDPAVRVGLAGRKGDSFGEAVLVLDARIGLLVQQHHVEGLGDGPLAVDRLRRQKGVRLAFVVERGAGEFHFARKVDPPVAVQVVVARHVPDGCNPTTLSSFYRIRAI